MDMGAIVSPSEFIAKWGPGGSADKLSERAGAQPHFIDLCNFIGVDTPADPENYCFERGAKRTGAGRGWADVWRRDHFAWEYKGPGGDLDKALKQLMTYALALDNPPLLVVSDRHLIQVHTHFTGTASEVHTIAIEDIGTAENKAKLRALFTAPYKFKPDRTVQEITGEAAGHFADIARSLVDRGHDPHQVAHFLIQCLFCMFAEDVELLPEHVFERIIEKRGKTPDKLGPALTELFTAMRKGGEFLLDDIPWFNGGLFEDIDVIPLIPEEVEALRAAAKMNWRHIEPSIFGTLFERGLNPDLRSQLGANYTDPGTIMKLVEPVIIGPLLQEWEETRNNVQRILDLTRSALQEAEAEIKTELTASAAAGGAREFKAKQASLAKKREARKGLVTKAENEARAAQLAFLNRLKNFRVLDPACGSGNFLYLALRALKDLEHRVNLEAEALGLHRELNIETSPANVLGIELNPYAAELARVTVWIGEIQWMLSHGYDVRRNPILASLNHVQCRDAILTTEGGEPDWPPCDVIVGNPPFLGDKVMKRELGTPYVTALRNAYEGQVPGGADLVTYWFERARAHIEANRCQRAGLVATNSIRGGANRRVLDRVVASTRIFEAWSDEPWINEGAAVRVSLICFGNCDGAFLDGRPVSSINSDLSAGDALNLPAARQLAENANAAYLGIQRTGPFDIPGDLARQLLTMPNPHLKPNSDVVKPWYNGLDITRRKRDYWIIDFGTDMPESEAMLYEGPYAYAKAHVQPTRVGKREARTNEMWWLFQWSRPVMRAAIAGLPRFIVTPEVAKHRVFSWVTHPVVPDKNLTVIARADDTTFGILQSRFHLLWSLRLGTSLEDRPRYTPTSCFETFPFPSGLAPRDTAHGAADSAIATAAARLNLLRENWLNPPTWVDVQPEVVSGLPDRVIPKSEHEAELRRRTMNNLYNAPPPWLENAHITLDQAVAAAYGWTDYTPEMGDDEILSRLLALNLSRVPLATSEAASVEDAEEQTAEVPA